MPAAGIPRVVTPCPGSSVQDQVNALIAQINGFLSGLNPEQVDITGGTIDNTVIGGTTPAAGSFTALNATSGAINGDTITTNTAAQTLTNKTLTSPAINGGTVSGSIINNSSIGQTVAAAGSFTTLSASTSLTVSALGLGVVHSSAGGLFSSSTIATGDIAAAAVTYAKIQNVAASSLLGNPTGAPAAPSEITLGATLAFSGSALQTTAHTSDVTSPANSNVMTIAANAVTFAKFQTLAALSVVGNGTNATANVGALTGTANQTLVVNSGGTALAFGALNVASTSAVTGQLAAASFPTLTGDVTTAGGALATTIAALAVSTGKIAANAVTYAKMQATSQAALLGATSATTVGEITLGQGLSFSGSTVISTNKEVITASIGADQNNYAIGGMSTNAAIDTILRVTPTVSFQFTGISSTSVANGKRLIIHNVSTNSSSGRMILLSQNNASSTAANRFNFDIGPIPIMLMPGDMVSFIYNTTSSLWEFEHGTRHASPMNYFDEWNDYTCFINSWSNGTGSNVGYNSGNFTSAPQNFIGLAFCQTGTTTTGRGVVGSPPFTFFVNTGCCVALTRWMVDTNLSNGTDTYIVHAGFTDQGNQTTPQNAVAFEYASATSANLQMVTYAGGVATRNSTGIAVAANTPYYCGVFVNSNGTNAEFFYSTNGTSWTFGTAITTNIPTASLGIGGGITKTAGTTSRQVDFDFHGYRVQRTR